MASDWHRHIKNLRAWHLARTECLDRDDHTCQTCGSTDDLTVDHVVPLDVLFANGVDADAIALAIDVENLITLCRSCNGRKGSSPVEPTLTRHTFVSPHHLETLSWLLDQRPTTDTNDGATIGVG